MGQGEALVDPKQYTLEEAFWRFVYQNWSDLLNMAAEERHSTDAGQEAKKMATDGLKKLSRTTLTRG
jgi:hypothetical protein